jgi:hypothetical protein
MHGPLRSLLLAASAAASLTAQQPPSGQPPNGQPPDGQSPMGQPPMGQMGMPGPPGGRELQVVERFDKNGDHRLDASERPAALTWLKENRSQRGGRGGPGGFGPGGFGPGGFGPGAGAAANDAHGAAVAVADAPTFAGKPFYDQDTVRTLFLTFPQADWYEELSDFYRTDVDLPATIVVDGTTYPDIGVHFRGNTSYAMVRGKKKSLHLSFDWTHDGQRVLGYRSTNLINGNEDPSCLREALNAFVSRRHAHALQANLVRVVINGEDFGVYVNLQHFNKDFLDENYGTGKGSRFKVPPDFSGNGALRDLGDDETDYRRNYQLKSDDDPQAWTRLRDLCQLLENGGEQELLLELPDYLDLDDALWFLVIDNAILDGDGYYSRGSDYALWLDAAGRFHPIARDGNEVLGAEEGGPPGMRGGPAPRSGQRDGQRDGTRGGPPFGGPGGPGRRGPGLGGPGMGGPGMRGGPRAPQVDQAALAMLGDPTRPLIRRLLAVPAWRERYLWFLHTIAATTLDDAVIGARLEGWRQAIDGYVRQDAHALYGYDAFARALAPLAAAAGDADASAANRSLRAAIAQRRKVLLADPALQGPWPEIADEVHELIQSSGAKMLRVTARCTGAARMTLHTAGGRVGAFGAVPMLDDGKHDDGAAGDGVFGATVPVPIGPVPTGVRALRFYVEAALANGRAACAPASGGARPRVVLLPGADEAGAPDAAGGADAAKAKEKGAKGKGPKEKGAGGHKKKRQD